MADRFGDWVNEDQWDVDDEDEDDDGFGRVSCDETDEHGVRDMDLLDILEMLADWKAASERASSKTAFADGFMYNKERFNIPDDLFQAMIYTVERLGWADILG